MKEASTVKIISFCKEDISYIIEALEKSAFTVVATSGVIFDSNTKKFHRFVSVTKQ